MLRIPQIVFFLFLGQSALVAQAQAPASIGTLELNQLLLETYSTSTFSGTMAIEAGLSEGFPEVGGASFRIPFGIEKCPDGFSLSFDSSEMEYVIPEGLRDEFSPEEIPEVSLKLQISKASGLLLDFDGPDGKVSFYINAATMESVTGLFEKVLAEQWKVFTANPLTDEQVKQELVKAMRDLAENPENTQAQQALVTPLIMAAMKDAKIYLVQRKDGTAYYSGDIFDICAVGAHRGVSLFPWAEIREFVEEEEKEEAEVFFRGVENLLKADVAVFREMAAAFRKVCNLELSYDFQMLSTGNPFFTGNSMQFSFGEKNTLGPSLNEAIQLMARTLNPGNPQAILDEIYADGVLMEQEEFIEFANAVGGQSGFIDMQLDPLNLSPIAAGALDFSIAGRTDVQDVSPMISAYLPMVEMAIQQELGMGGAAGAELEF